MSEFNPDNPGELLRAAADGELDAAGEQRLRDHLAAHPEDEARVAFERGLRGACGRTMRVETPAGLRGRVVAALRAEEDLAGSLERKAAHTRRPSFWTGPLGSITSVAAVLALAFVILQLTTGILSSTGPIAQAAQVASFVGGEHDHCTIDPAHAAAKFDIKELDRVPDAFAELTGETLRVDQLVAGGIDGLVFVGAGECRVPPAHTPSLHLRFRSDGSVLPECVTVSIFIQPYTGYVEMQEGRFYRIGDDSQLVYGWVKGGVVSYLVADAPEPCEQLREAMGLPAAVPID